MATYKLIQDIEAEDHILGPLTFRQFVFALISAFFLYLCFLCASKGGAFLLIIFLPPALFFGFFAVPFGKDQPTEVWALAKLRFFLKPRKRIWDQSGVKQLVTITVPKKVEQVLTDGLSPYEVKSRLTVLANTLDSRGWAIKNSSIGSAPLIQPVNGSSDRLIDLNGIAGQNVPEEQVPIDADILEDTTSPLAQNFEQMITRSSQDYRDQLIQQMNSPQQPQPARASSGGWFMPPTAATASATTQVADNTTTSTPGDEALDAQLKARHSAQQVYSSNLRTIQPAGTASTLKGSQAQTNQPLLPTQPPKTDQLDPAILSLASNDDFNLATIAREAQRVQNSKPGDDEVIIKLH